VLERAWASRSSSCSCAGEPAGRRGRARRGPGPAGEGGGSGAGRRRRASVLRQIKRTRATELEIRAGARLVLLPPLPAGAAAVAFAAAVAAAAVARRGPGATRSRLSASAKGVGEDRAGACAHGGACGGLGRLWQGGPVSIGTHGGKEGAPSPRVWSCTHPCDVVGVFRGACLCCCALRACALRGGLGGWGWCDRSRRLWRRGGGCAPAPLRVAAAAARAAQGPPARIPGIPSRAPARSGSGHPSL
jgi:hypothetical protein